MCLNHVIHVHHSIKEPEAPTDLKATNSGSNDVTLEWTKPKVTTKEGLNYIVSSIEMSSILDKSSEKISETSCIFLFLYVVKNVWCVARHVENLDKKIFKTLTLAKILCWTFWQLLLPSSAKGKKCKCFNGVLMVHKVC